MEVRILVGAMVEDVLERELLDRVLMIAGGRRRREENGELCCGGCSDEGEQQSGGDFGSGAAELPSSHAVETVGMKIGNGKGSLAVVVRVGKVERERVMLLLLR